MQPTPSEPHGQIVALQRRPQRGAPTEPVPELQLTRADGVVGDHATSARRQVTLVAEEAWREATTALGQPVDWQARRANVLVRGVDLAASIGRVLALGACRVEVLGETRPCEVMDEAAAGLQAALVPACRAGVYGAVLEEGVIRPGDGVRVEDRSSAP